MDREDRPSRSGRQRRGEGWAATDLDTSAWKPMQMPTDVTKHGVPSGSVTWYRKEITVPEAHAGKDLVLTLGVVDDLDVTFFNGQQVGATDLKSPSWWSAQRRYTVPGTLVKTGRNVIAIRNHDLDGTAGLTGPAAAMRATFADSAAPEPSATTTRAATQPAYLPLTGTWLHRVEHVYQPPQGQQPLRPLPPYKLDSAWTPGTLYNGMIAPIGDYAIRGVTWYQGESNAVRHSEYEAVMTSLIESWREQFKVGDFPFYIVSLANFRAATDDPNASSDWAWLRERSGRFREGEERRHGDRHRHRRSVGHPSDQQAGSGSSTRAHRVEGDVRQRSRVARADVEGGVVRWCAGPADVRSRRRRPHAAGEKLSGFTVAGADGRFAWADARVEGDRVVVSSPTVTKPITVRYAFADNPTPTLFNQEGLPAEPFTVSK
jgi:sialate O-acetylesterase